MTYWWNDYARAIPRGRFSVWTVDDLRISAAQLAANSGRMRRFDKDLIDPDEPGDYTVLSVMNSTYERKTMMADSLAEVGDALPFIARGRGHVLVTGLGLGIVAHGLARRDEVSSVTVVEKSRAVLSLCSPTATANPKIRVIAADAFRWQPDRRFDCAWHDLWLLIGASNVRDMNRLRAHYAPHVDGPQECWLEALCRVMARVKSHRPVPGSLTDEVGAFYHDRRAAVAAERPPSIAL